VRATAILEADRLIDTELGCVSIEESMRSAGLDFYNESGPGLDGVIKEGGGDEPPSSGAHLVLMRHGESMWNDRNLFTGCVDVPLSKKGVQEAIAAGKRIANVPVDVIFTSALARSQVTAQIAMTEHISSKVPVVLYRGTDERAIYWSRCHSEETARDIIPIVRTWQLNERMYGRLQGYNKAEMAESHGEEKVFEWRRSYETAPPGGESLEMTGRRVQAFFLNEVEPMLAKGHNVMISAHANSLRSLVMFLEDFDAEEVVKLKVSTAMPLLYRFERGALKRSGMPQSSDAPGVYALSPELAMYRDTFDTMKPGYSS